MQWYEYNKSINTSIQIMMIRSQKPLSITVGPFGEVSLEMAVKIIKAAYTYVMFMKQVYEEK
uniref:Odorant receptor 23 n=1 Tax=Apriona germarii TaxID=157307 RepID=A0A7G7WNC1_APRGE|nr:odorant receptor 23 [Apriona germarii]